MGTIDIINTALDRIYSKLKNMANKLRDTTGRSDLFNIDQMTNIISQLSGEADIEEILKHIEILYTITESLSDRIDSLGNNLIPESVDTIGDCIDTSKLYMLPDGFIYAYMLGVVSYKNQVPCSIDIDGSVYNQIGYSTGRLSSTDGTVTTSNDMSVTGFIPCKAGDIIRLQGIHFNKNSSQLNNHRVMYYDTSKTFLTGAIFQGSNIDNAEAVWNSAGDLIQFTVNGYYGGQSANYAYFRICGDIFDSDAIITVNEAIFAYTNIIDIIGYNDGKYVSGTTLDNDETTVATNIFAYDCSLDVPPAIYVKGVEWTTTNSHCCLVGYTEPNGPTLGAINLSSTAFASWYSIDQLGDKYYRFTPTLNSSGIWTGHDNEYVKDCKYLRMSFVGTGADLILTLDQPVENIAWQWTNTGLAFVTSEYRDQISDLEGKANTLDEKVTEQSEQVSKLDEKVTEQSEQVSELDEKVTEQSEQVSELENKTNTLDEKVTRQGEQVSELANQLALIENGDKVPVYIHEEAERVADIVLEKRTAQSLVFAAAGDFHCPYGTNTDQATIHTGIGITQIRKYVPIDFIGLFGNFVRGGSDSTIAESRAALKFIRKSMYDAGLGVQQIWMQGNHDRNPYDTDDGDLTDEQLYSYIFASNSGTIIDPDNVQRGYGYKDFPAQKIRVIYWNTSDISGAETIEDFMISASQYQWMSNTAFDFSNKDDAEKWGIVVLSHMPVNWGTNGVSSLSKFIDAYISGTSATIVAADNVNITVNFTNRNQAEFICAINGHTHNFRYSQVGTNKFWQIAVPQVCFGRYNEYGTSLPDIGGELDDSGNPVYYYKTTDSTQSTSFCIFVIDRTNKKIHAIHYGAGTDREINYTVDLTENWISPEIDDENGITIVQAYETNYENGILDIR